MAEPVSSQTVPVFPFGPFASAAVYTTNDRVVYIRGDDARSWLNGQVTSDLKTLAADRALYVLSINVKGRVLSDGWALEQAEGLALVLPEHRLAGVLESFDKHIIMEDVEVHTDDTLRVLTVQGPRAEEVLIQAGLRGLAYHADRLGSNGYDLWVPQAEVSTVSAKLESSALAVGGGQVGDDLLNEAHVRAGIPRSGVDFADHTYPQEAGLKQRAVSFNKGCYLGQEVICMLENRGQLNRRLVQLERAGEAGLASGSVVFDAQGKRVGEVTSSATARLDSGAATFALAYIKRPLAEVGAKVHASEQEWTVRAVVGLAPETCPVIAQ